jgi:trimeric autotransporter adhesin
MKKIYLLSIVFLLNFSNNIKAQTWNSVGSGLDGYVNAMAVFNNELYVAGYFTTAGGQPASNIAKWNGSSWQAVGNGITGANAEVYALKVYNSELYAAGYFYDAGGVSVNNMAKWNGAVWSAVGAGAGNGANDYVYTLEVYGSYLYAGGEFASTGGVPSNYIGQTILVNGMVQHGQICLTELTGR